MFKTIKNLRAEQGNANVADPIKIDLTKPETWPDPSAKLYDVIFVINLFQVAPVSIIDGIAQVAARVFETKQHSWRSTARSRSIPTTQPS